MTPRVLLACALALGVAAPIACKRDEQAAAVAVAAPVRIAPVVADHPWVMAFLTEVSITRPPGADARLEGRTEPDGRYLPEPVFQAERREALAEFLRDYEKTHPRPPELLPVWEQLSSVEGAKVWQLHFVDAPAGFELDEGARARLEPGAMGPAVVLELSSAQTEQFAGLTRAQIGQRIAIVIADEVVNIPVVRAEVPGGRIQLRTDSGVDPEVAAPALLERLKQSQ